MLSERLHKPGHVRIGPVVGDLAVDDTIDCGDAEPDD
jgi:hypothetical protein